MRLIFLLLSLLSLSWVLPNTTVSERARSILVKSSSFHDPGSRWDDALLTFHIEEPRIDNPTRYSEIFLNVSDGTFSLVRNREDHLATYIMDANGKPMVLLDGNESIDEEIRARYRLYPDKVSDYRNFYRVMYGLPMSIRPQRVKRFDEVKNVEFDGHDALAISFEWKESVIKSNWTLYVDKISYTILGVDMFDKDSPTEGERIIFRGLVDYEDMRIPHMRHWYDLQDVTYIGSDIIISSTDS